MKAKQRVNWHVQIHPFNFSKGNDVHPRPVIRGTFTLDDLARELEERTHGHYRAEETALFISQLVDIAEDILIDGYALSTPLGTLTPTITGMWNYDRIQPTARQQNQATLSYSMSKRIKGLFANPLFHALDPHEKAGPYISKVLDLHTRQVNDSLTPGNVILVDGRLLLMNGESPLRGVELLEADTGRRIATYLPQDLLLNSRSQFSIRLPDELADGEYQLAVTSQCCTKPTPLREPVRRVSQLRLRVGAPLQAAAEGGEAVAAKVETAVATKAETAAAEGGEKASQQE